MHVSEFLFCYTPNCLDAYVGIDEHRVENLKKSESECTRAAVAGVLAERSPCPCPCPCPCAWVSLNDHARWPLGLRVLATSSCSGVT